MPEFEPSDVLSNSLGTSANTIFDDFIPTQKEDEEILKDFFDQYNIESIKDTMDEKGEVSKYIYLL